MAAKSFLSRFYLKPQSREALELADTNKQTIALSTLDIDLVLTVSIGVASFKFE